MRIASQVDTGHSKTDTGILNRRTSPGGRSGGEVVECCEEVAMLPSSRGVGHLISRRMLVSVLPALLPAKPHKALAIEVQQRSEQERLARQLYAPLPAVQAYTQQISDAISIKSLRGVWSLRETRGALKETGELVFRGSAMEERGRVTYAGQAASGSGPWIIKADGFGRSPTGDGGVIEQKALWKLRRGAGGQFQYAGRVNVAGRTNGLPDATIEGDIIELVDGGKPKGGSERKVGQFRARLERMLTAEEESAASESGPVEAVRVTCVASTDVRCR
jgi:hypothetical protein